MQLVAKKSRCGVCGRVVEHRHRSRQKERLFAPFVACRVFRVPPVGLLNPRLSNEKLCASVPGYFDSVLHGSSNSS